MNKPENQMKRGKEITERWLARQLRPYGARTKPMWIGEEAARGYEREHFQEAFMRYIPKGQARRMLDELLAMRTRPKENGPGATGGE